MTGMQNRDKSLDVVVFGASSFVGQILVHYLFETFGLDGDLRWAAAGRSRDKLEGVRRDLGAAASRLELLVADAADSAALQALCTRTRVVVSTVGPYALHGEPLVQACAESGTDYCDLTGEVQWIRRMLANHEATAQRTGARIVHCCGFDSIPSDLGVHYLQQEARRRLGAPCGTVKMRVRELRGGFSGGSAASLLNVLKEVSRDPSLRRELSDPYSLWPAATARPRVRQHNLTFTEHDPDFDGWVAPFVMSAINTRIVHRSNGLGGLPYGEDFRYDEAVLTGRGLAGRVRAASLAAALGGFMLAGSVGPTRGLLERFVLPQPGEGPSPDEQRCGRFDLRFHGRTTDGRTLRTRVHGDCDPGYGSTAKMLGQAAACLSRDVAEARGGFWTPATLFGDRLVARLRAHSGLTFDVVDGTTPA